MLQYQNYVLITKLCILQYENYSIIVALHYDNKFTLYCDNRNVLLMELRYDTRSTLQ